MEEKQNTKDKILNIAENCFAQYGFDGSSIRDIVIEAKVNNAAIFYHFKTKQKLFESVFDRLASPVVNQRLELLSQCDKNKNIPMLRQILLCYLTPALKTAFANNQQRFNFSSIRMQLSQKTHPFMSELLTKHFTITGEKFLNALSEELVELSKKDLQWRYHIMVGALTFLMGSAESIKSGNFASRKENYAPFNMNEAFKNFLPQMELIFLAPPIKTRK